MNFQALYGHYQLFNIGTPDILPAITGDIDNLGSSRISKSVDFLYFITIRDKYIK